MAKATSRYICQECGAVHPRWAGKCDACGGWNCIVEEAAPSGPLGKGNAGKGLGAPRRIDFVSLNGPSAPPPRYRTGVEEFDRVCGGGLVPGSAILIGGDPGIGKSTLLLQTVSAVARQVPCVYISGEEAIDQVRLRALRLGLAEAPVGLASATDVREIIAALDVPDGPKVAVIDSIQTMYLDTLDSAPGTVSQVRACGLELIRVAKRRGTVLLLVGHVTKEGTIAGPRVLEHMVDTVLHFEGERGHHFRLLRAVKNRFGPTDEIGVFEMAELGLREVANPSALFLEGHRGDVSGAAVYAGMEGTRPILVEIQALVAPSAFGTPRRAVIGWDPGRLAMVLAVLEARCGVAVGVNDVYLNVAGGMKVTEPAADLAVAAALLSSLTGISLPKEVVVFGEVGLSGEVRGVSQMDNRLKEAAKLGFSRAMAPQRRGLPGAPPLDLEEVRELQDLLPYFRDENRAEEL